MNRSIIQLMPLIVSISIFSANRTELEKFNKNDFFKLYYEALEIQPNQLAQKYIADYYNTRYQCNIKITDLIYENFLETSYHEFLLMCNTQNQNDYRYGFMIGGTDYKHAVPCIFNRYDNNDYLIILDSIGCEYQKTAYEKLAAFPGTVFFLKELRQVDVVSCFVDALILLRDATRKNSTNNQYVINKLTPYLEVHARKVHEDFQIFEIKKLPDMLLKTVQYKEFFKNFFDPESEKTIYSGNKTTTINEFRNQYTIDEGFYLKINKKKPFFQTGNNYYLKIKAFKLLYYVALLWYIKNHRSILDEKDEYSIIKSAPIHFSDNSQFFDYTKRLAEIYQYITSNKIVNKNL